MDRLIEYFNHHPYLVGAAVLALIAVLVYESRMRTSAYASISSQDLIRLMNQGALVLDIRTPEEYKQGQSGFAVLDILATKDTFAAEGIIKILEEETNEEKVELVPATP